MPRDQENASLGNAQDNRCVALQAGALEARRQLLPYIIRQRFPAAALPLAFTLAKLLSVLRVSVWAPSFNIRAAVVRRSAMKVRTAPRMRPTVQQPRRNCAVLQQAKNETIMNLKPRQQND